MRVSRRCEYLSKVAKIKTEEAQVACEILGVTSYFVGQIDRSTKIDNQWYQKVIDYLVEEQPDAIFNSGHSKMEEFRGMKYGCAYAEVLVDHHQNPQKYFL